MNQGSNQSPYAVVGMVLLLLSHPRGGPHAKFFCRDGRSLPFGDSQPYSRPLMDPSAGMDRTAGPQGSNPVQQKPCPAAPSHRPLSPPVIACEASPRLLYEGYKGFNIVLYNSEYHAISQEIGPVDLPRVSFDRFQEWKKQGKWIVVHSAEGLVEKLEQEVNRRRTSSCRAPLRYPIDIPPVDFFPRQDLILLELPPRYMPMMPNGLGYVHGILSRYDSPNRGWQPAPLLEDLDAVDFPRYEWVDLSAYRTYDGAHLVPITASRGCRWSRCSFCCECFPWRRRSPESVVNEMEWFAKRGGRIFHFNESDLNGDPEALLAIGDEIVRRKLKIGLTGQLRIDRRSDRNFFDRLRRAGFFTLRFGVDGWSQNTLRLQRKGYSFSLVEENLRDCHEAGIQAGVNLVIGVPGETEEDVEDSIENILRNKNHIRMVDNIHALILAHGSEYYENPEAHSICFRGDKNELYDQYPEAIPPHLWFNENPYIDQEVRVKRMKKVYETLRRNGVAVGAYAESMVDKTEKELEARKGSRDVENQINRGMRTPSPDLLPAAPGAWRDSTMGRTFLLCQ
jgi:radical SAM superfamily enzyme YgiQ (UPF0313 family)